MPTWPSGPRKSTAWAPGIILVRSDEEIFLNSHGEREHGREFCDELVIKDNVLPPAYGRTPSTRVWGDIITELTYNTRNLVPDRESATLPDPHNDTKTRSPHDLTELNRRGVGPLAVVQPRSHGGVEGNPCHLDQDLTRSDLKVTGRLRLTFECGRGDVFCGTFVEDILFVGRGQGHGRGVGVHG